MACGIPGGTLCHWCWRIMVVAVIMAVIGYGSALAGSSAFAAEADGPAPVYGSVTCISGLKGIALNRYSRGKENAAKRTSRRERGEGNQGRNRRKPGKRRRAQKGAKNGLRGS